MGIVVDWVLFDVVTVVARVEVEVVVVVMVVAMVVVMVVALSVMVLLVVDPEVRVHGEGSMKLPSARQV